MILYIYGHDRMVIDHSVVVSISKLSMLTSDLPSLRSGKSDVSMLSFEIDTPTSWSIPTIDTSISCSNPTIFYCFNYVHYNRY